jgi:hypothetical protein
MALENWRGRRRFENLREGVRDSLIPPGEVREVPDSVNVKKRLRPAEVAGQGCNLAVEFAVKEAILRGRGSYRDKSQQKKKGILLSF